MKMHTILASLLATSFSLSAPYAQAADPAPLPAKMKGSRTNPSNGRSGSVDAELISMESPTMAKLKTAFWDGCTRRGESTAEFKDGTWSFVIPGGRCDDVSVTVHPVEDKNRLEGEFRTGPNAGTIYYEW
jgi:hypothetical protein